MHFEIAHELDAPLDVVERAVLSRELGDVLADELKNGDSIESVETRAHELRDGELFRVLRFQASAPLPMLRKYPVARDAMSWEETSRYRVRDHASDWTVAPKEEYRRYFSSRGTYVLETTTDGKTRRTVRGELEVHVKLLGGLVERMALTEVKKTYDAEAATLRRLVHS